MIAKYFPALVFLVFTSSSIAQEAARITPEEVLQQVKHVGARQTILACYDKERWPTIVKGIASGSSGWLQVYVALEPGADGAAGEDLGEAIYDALPVQPFKVLPILMADGKNTAEQICTFSFEASIPQDGVSPYLDRLERSLSKADDTNQRQMAESCGRGIQVTRAAYKSNQ